MHTASATAASDVAGLDLASGHPPPPSPADPPGGWARSAIRASDLQGISFEPLRYVLPGYIPEGVTLLVSRPRLGKSWLVLDLCIAIAADRVVLGGVKPASGDVLYLALEDGERRLQRRLAKLSRNANAWPWRLTLATHWLRADEGGFADIRDWCKRVKRPTAVVIDTLEKFRGFNDSGGQPYHDAVVALQRLASEHHMAVIVVHHQRKTNTDDPFDTVGGTIGLASTADTILMMKQAERGAVLHVRGRDVEDSDTLMAFDRESCRWGFCGPASAPLSESPTSWMRRAAAAALSIPCCIGWWPTATSSV